MHISNRQKVALSAVFKDKDGVIVPVSGTPVWSTSDASIVTLVTAVDGLSTSAISVDSAVGSSTITLVSGDLTATLVIDVTEAGPNPPTSVEILVGAVSDK